MKYPKWASHAINVSQNEKNRVKLQNIRNLKWGLGILGIEADPQEETYEVDGITFKTHTDSATLKVVIEAYCGTSSWQHSLTHINDKDNLRATVSLGEWLVRVLGGTDEEETP